MGSKLEADKRHELLWVDENRLVSKASAAREELERNDVLVQRRARGAHKRKAVLAHTLRAAEAKAVGQKQLLWRTARLVEDEPARAAVVLSVPHRERLVAAVALEARLVLLPLGHVSCKHPDRWFVADLPLFGRNTTLASQTPEEARGRRKETKQQKQKQKKKSQILEMKWGSGRKIMGGN